MGLGSFLCDTTGNIQASDFVHMSESPWGIFLITAYTILVVIIMLNLLISIVDQVYEDTMAHRATEFVKAKAQIINVSGPLSEVWAMTVAFDCILCFSSFLFGGLTDD